MLYSEVATPETPTLDALAFEWPELPQFDPLQVDTSGVQIDARPPLQSHASQPSEGGLVINGGINIEIHAAPGMDEQVLAMLVNAEVQRALRDAERRAQARHRSWLEALRPKRLSILPRVSRALEKLPRSPWSARSHTEASSRS